MTDVASLLADCAAKGIRLLPASDDGLTIDAPQDALTPDLMERLKVRKVELLTVLRPAIDPSNASAVWQAALDGIEGDPLFEPGMMKTLRAADVRWASDEAATEEADDSEPDALGPDGWPLGSIDPDELEPCPKCGTLELWQTLKGDWRCLRCDPPHRIAVSDRGGRSTTPRHLR